MPFLFILFFVFLALAGIVRVFWNVKKQEISGLRDSFQDPQQPDPEKTLYDRYNGRHKTIQAPELIRKAEASAVPYKLAFQALLVTAALMLLFSCIAIVGTKKVGVVTSFNRPVGTLSNGLHLKFPWQKVHELDGAIQTDTHNDTTIRLGNQSTATVRNSIRWRIRPGTADELYRDYRDFDKIRDSLVTRELTAALNEVFKTYDPLGSIKDAAADAKRSTPTEFGDAVAEALRKRIGREIDVRNVIIPLAEYDPATQSRLNAYQEEIANTRIAEQKQRTAEANAKANRKLASSVSRDPNVLVSKCLDTLAEVAKANQPLPAGFSCWPGGRESAIAVK